MNIDLTTPALLFPAISLLLLAYTNRFVVLSNLIRNLHEKYRSNPHEIFLDQIKNLRKRVYMIKNMQVCGVGSFFFCTVAMICLFLGWIIFAKIVFAVALILLLASLFISIMEIRISVGALDIHLRDLEENPPKNQISDEENTKS